MDKGRIEELTVEAKKLVAKIVAQTPHVVAAYSDGSFAREDMVRGSDVDIGVIVASDPGGFKVHREIVVGTVFEWALIGREAYGDIASILGNAGFVHDLVSAKIWYDPDKFLSRLRRRLSREYMKPELVRLRAVNQLKIIEGKFEEFAGVVRRNDAEGLLGTLFAIVKYAFGVPSAVLNRPVTNCRGYLFCKRDSHELGFFDYPGLILDMLGASGFGADTVKGLLDSAYKLFDASGLPRHERETYKRHLEIAGYMVEIGEPAAAAWPVFFWAVGAWHEVKRDGLKAVARNIYESLGPIRTELKLVEGSDIRRRARLIERVLELGTQMVDGGRSGGRAAGSRSPER